MNEDRQREIAERVTALTKLFIAYGISNDVTRIAIYAEAVRGYAGGIVLEAVDTVLRTVTSSYLPPPAVVVQACRDTIADHGTRAVMLLPSGLPDVSPLREDPIERAWLEADFKRDPYGAGYEAVKGIGDRYARSRDGRVDAYLGSGIGLMCARWAAMNDVCMDTGDVGAHARAVRCAWLRSLENSSRICGDDPKALRALDASS